MTLCEQRQDFHLPAVDLYTSRKLLPFDCLPFLLFQNVLYFQVELDLLQSTFSLMSVLPFLSVVWIEPKFCTGFTRLAL